MYHRRDEFLRPSPPRTHRSYSRATTTTTPSSTVLVVPRTTIYLNRTPERTTEKEQQQLQQQPQDQQKEKSWQADECEVESVYVPAREQPDSKAFGRYVNWSRQHAVLAAYAWVVIGDLHAFCDKYEFKTIGYHETNVHNRIVAEVRTLLSGEAPFSMRHRFPTNIRCPENLWLCIGLCSSVEYHLNRILNLFRARWDQMLPTKQRGVRQDFQMAVMELRLDISGRISEVRLYDRLLFEHDFRLEWQNNDFE